MLLRSGLSVFQRGFKGNLLASCINPVNIKWRVRRKKDLTWRGTETSGPMDMMTGHIHEISIMSNKRPGRPSFGLQASRSRSSLFRWEYANGTERHSLE